MAARSRHSALTPARQAKRFWATNHPDWLRLRRYLLDREPTCRHCREAGRLVPATHVDHVNGRADRLEDYLLANLQPLCESCHAVKTAQENSSFGHAPGTTSRRGCDANGTPLDAGHHWKKPR